MPTCFMKLKTNQILSLIQGGLLATALLTAAHSKAGTECHDGFEVARDQIHSVALLVQVGGSKPAVPSILSSAEEPLVGLTAVLTGLKQHESIVDDLKHQDPNQIYLMESLPPTTASAQPRLNLARTEFNSRRKNVFVVSAQGARSVLAIGVRGVFAVVLSSGDIGLASPRAIEVQSFLPSDAIPKFTFASRGALQFTRDSTRRIEKIRVVEVPQVDTSNFLYTPELNLVIDYVDGGSRVYTLSEDQVAALLKATWSPAR